MWFGVLGPVDVRNGDTVVSFGRPRQRAVLGYLLLNAGRAVTVDQLVEALWGGTEPSTARSQVQSDAAALRRTLAQFNPSCLTKTAGGAYRVDVAPEDLDLQMFLDLIRRARRVLPNQPAQAADDARTALSLWRGSAFSDVKAAYVEAARVWLDESRLAVYELIADAELALGRHAELVAELTPVVGAHPLRESLATRLMLALYRAGRQAEALQVARRVRAELSEREGLDPSRALTDLETAILRTDPELDHEPAGAAQPGRASMVAVPAQLPPAVVGFAGRRAYLDRLNGLCTEHPDVLARANVVIALVGTAGVGKTALAVRWAHEVRHRFPGGQLYADMRAYSSAPPLRPIDVLARFLTALGVPDNRVPSDLDEAVALYRSLLADRRALVLLDNAGRPEDVRPLLPGSGCLVIVTSRNRMSGLVAGEGAQQVALDVLDADEATELVTHIVGVERAVAEPHAVAAMTDVCAGLPLALCIAAANVVAHPVRSIDDYVVELRAGGSLEMLELDGDDAAVRAAFEPSYRALAAPERRMWRLCGLAPGRDVTAEAAAALGSISPPAAKRLLDRLASGHLLTEHASGRYSCHDLLRQYAIERGLREDSPDERSAGLRRLYAYYIATADAAVDLVKPGNPRLVRDDVGFGSPPRRFDSTGDALAWLDGERANLIAAVRAGAEGGTRREAGRLADALRGYLWVRSNVVDWLVIDTAALSAAVADGDASAEAAAHLSLGNVHSRTGQFPVALRHYERAIEEYERFRNRDGLAAALNGLGHVHRNTGRLEDAAKQYGEALVLRREHGAPATAAVSVLSLALVYHDMGRLESAAEYTQQAADLFRAAGSRHGEGAALSSLGEVCQALGRFERARTHLDRALELTREAGSRWNEAETLRVLAEVDRDVGRYDEAAARAGEALELATAVDADMLKPYILNTLGSVLRCRGRHGEAIEHHQDALEQARRHDARLPEVDALLGLALAHLDLGQPERARTLAEHVLGLAWHCGYRLREGHALLAVGGAHLIDDRPVDASRAGVRALTVYRACHHPLGEARALLLLGRAQEAVTDLAARHWLQATEILAALGAPEAGEARALLAQVTPDIRLHPR